MKFLQLLLISLQLKLLFEYYNRNPLGSNMHYPKRLTVGLVNKHLKNKKHKIQEIFQEEIRAEALHIS